MFCVWSRYIGNGNIIHYVYSDSRFQMVNMRRGGGTFCKNTLIMLLVYFYKLNYFLIINHNLECCLKPPNYRLWCFLFRVFSLSLLLSHSCLKLKWSTRRFCAVQPLIRDGHNFFKRTKF